MSLIERYPLTIRHPFARGASGDVPGDRRGCRYVGSPAAMLGDLALAIDEVRLGEDAEYLRAVVQGEPADAQAVRLGLEDRGDAGGRDAPDLDGDRAATA